MQIVREKILIRYGVTVFLLGAAFLFLAWRAAPVLFIVFAGCLGAAIFHYAAHWLSERTGIGRQPVLLLLVITLLALIGGALFWGGAALVQQFGELARSLEEQVTGLLRTLSAETSLDSLSEKSFAGMLPNPASVMSSVTTLSNLVLTGVGNVFVVLFLAAFIAWRPSMYRQGFVSLFPVRHRERIETVVIDATRRMGRWALGQCVAVIVIFATGWLMLSLIGMPFALILALQAGLLAFIPTIGPIIAGIPIILAGLSVGPQMALWGFGVYILIQGLESYLLTPLVQRRMVALPPALTLGTQLVFGALFGLGGLMMAVPMLTVILTFVQKLYIEDYLERGSSAVE